MHNGYLGAVILRPPKEDNLPDLVQYAVRLFEDPTFLTSFPDGKI